MCESHKAIHSVHDGILRPAFIELLIHFHTNFSQCCGHLEVQPGPIFWHLVRDGVSLLRCHDT